MKYRVLLVDDDMIVRIFLQNMVRWESCGFEVCGVARDGGEAFAQYQNKHPDLILTDISMPQVDGIELIRQLRGHGYEGVIIVLSCHDDFGLVKNAMQAGADDYLLKNHVDENAMETLLSTLRAKVEARYLQNQQKQLLQSRAQRGLSSFRHELLKDILSGKLSGAALAEQLRLAGMEGKYLRLAGGFIRPIQADAEQIALFFSLCTERVQNGQAETVPLSDDVLAMLIDLTAIPSMQQAQHIVTRLQNIVQSIAEQYLNIPIALAASTVCAGTSAWGDALRQAWDMLEYSFYGAGRWQYGESPGLSQQSPPTLETFEKGLPQLLEQGDADTLQQQWQAALEAARQSSLSPGVLLSWLRRCDYAAGVSRAESEYSSLSLSLDNYAGCVEAYLRRRTELQQSHIPDGVSAPVRQAILYLQSHYQQQIGLEDAANAAGLTAGYLSTRFKKETGTGFAEYLLGIRLAHVKQTLLDTGLTVKTVSEQAGFQDYSYFYRAFRKKVGMTPKEYRRQAGSI